jgi:hypothetical protein
MQIRSTLRNSIRRAALLACTVLGLAVATGRAQADTVTFDFNTSFGAVPSDGTAPWLRAEFTDIAPGEVRLTLTAPGLSTDTAGGQAAEYADEWWFNLNPLYDANSLVSTYLSGEEAIKFIVPATAGGGELKPDGDGTFDFRFNFASGTLSNGMSSVYRLSGIAGLTAADFRYYSQEPSGGAGPFLAAAHIQSTGPNNEGSDYVAPVDVAEPSSLALLAAGAFAFGASRRRRTR